MNNSQLEHNRSVEEYSLKDLFDKPEINAIEIPIIQRDYAQGRESRTNIREMFLDSIFKDLRYNKPLKLDFIYGTINAGYFIPLDGQQRLTTLFLLYWYIAIVEDKITGFLDIFASDNKSKFTYTTRASATEFCNELVTRINGTELIKEIKASGAVSTVIKNRLWYFAVWDRDPTIDGMLRMLDAIRNKYKEYNQDNKQFFGNLQNITFQFLDLEKFKLTDDLYIKMNARGKELTEFEIFKAKFEQHIEEQKWEVGIKETEKFSHKVDTKWTDLFWKYRDNENKIDDAFMRFITSVAIILRAQQGKGDKREESKKRIKILHNDLVDKELKEIRGDEDFSNLNDFCYLKECLDIYAEVVDNKFINAERELGKIQLWYLLNSEYSSFFKECTSNKEYSYNKRVIFYAQTEYLRRNKNRFNVDNYYNWLRVVRNLIVTREREIDNSNIVLAIQLVQELSEGCSNIYEYLAKKDIKITTDFVKEQVQEERVKAALIYSNGEWNNEWRQCIHEAEDHLLFQGSVRFLMNNYKDEQEINVNKINFDIFKKRLEVAKIIFNKDGITDKYHKDGKALFLRSFVSKINNFDTLKRIKLGGSSGTWKDIFKKPAPKEALERALDDATTYNANKKEWLGVIQKETSSIVNEHKAVHEILYKSELLGVLTNQGSNDYTDLYVINRWGGYWLHAHNKPHRNNILIETESAKTQRSKIIKSITSLISDELVKLIKPDQLTNWEEKIPYFYEVQIRFRYKEREFEWNPNNTITLISQENNNTGEELTNSDDITRTLNKLLSEDQKNPK